MPDLRFDMYYQYAALTEILQDFEQRYPQLVRLESLGESPQGRPIWLLVVTNFLNGPDDEKSALWVDGNMHALEIAPSSACLYLLEYLLTRYGQHSEVTRCLDSRVFYICPRVDPDGAELALAETPRYVRSGARLDASREDIPAGFVVQDIDGDGRILTMRIPDPHGVWKPYPQDPRLLIRREPTEVGGEYYRLLSEGIIENYDGALIPRPSHETLAGLAPESAPEDVSSPFSFFPREVRGVARFIAEHANVTACISLHTFGGMLLMPYANYDSSAMPAEDMWTYRRIGERGTALTGYPALSIYEGSLHHPQKLPQAGIIDWLYDLQGIFAWGVEMWCPQRQAGVAEFDFSTWFREHSLEDELKMIRWSDAALDGQGYVNWYPFEHPQLGPLELGGWDGFHVFANPPTAFLEQEIAPLAEWMLWHALISPQLEILSASARLLAGGRYLVRLVIHNRGWLPTYLTKKALERRVVADGFCDIEIPPGATLESGPSRAVWGQLEGRAYKPAFPDANDFTDDRAKLEWVVYAPQGGVVKLAVRHERTGVQRTQLSLDPCDELE